MGWEERLRPAVYVSPSGVRVPFDYEDVGSALKKRTTPFEFPDADGTYVQELGAGGRRYPIRAFFWGENHDLLADVFDAALVEKGVGKLEHPLYGVINVVPFGDITRRDRLKNAANQTIIKVAFWETTGLIYPIAGTDPASNVIDALEAYNVAQAEEFAESIDLDTASDKATFKSRYERVLVAVGGKPDGALVKVAATKDDVEKQFDTIYDSITLGIDVLVSDPLTLAFQTAILIQAPARALAAIGDRMTAYWGLLGLIVDQGVESSVPAFRTNDLFASTYLTGPVLSVVNNEFSTKTEALEAAESILDHMQTLIAWRDDNIDALDIIDPGAAYQKLQEAVAIAAGFLVEISFTLKQERRVIVSKPRTIIDLAAELYGEVDPVLDFLISSNSLTGSEILELPRGREIVYYV